MRHLHLADHNPGGAFQPERVREQGGAALTKADWTTLPFTCGWTNTRITTKATGESSATRSRTSTSTISTSPIAGWRRMTQALDSSWTTSMRKIGKTFPIPFRQVHEAGYLDPGELWSHQLRLLRKRPPGPQGNPHTGKVPALAHLLPDLRRGGTQPSLEHRNDSRAAHELRTKAEKNSHEVFSRH